MSRWSRGTDSGSRGRRSRRCWPCRGAAGICAGPPGRVAPSPACRALRRHWGAGSSRDRRGAVRAPTGRRSARLPQPLSSAHGVWSPLQRPGAWKTEARSRSAARRSDPKNPSVTARRGRIEDRRQLRPVGGQARRAAGDRRRDTPEAQGVRSRRGPSRSSSGKATSTSCGGGKPSNLHEASVWHSTPRQSKGQ